MNKIYRCTKGVTIPSGIVATWPNELYREVVRLRDIFNEFDIVKVTMGSYINQLRHTVSNADVDYHDSHTPRCYGSAVVVGKEHVSLHYYDVSLETAEGIRREYASVMPFTRRDLYDRLETTYLNRRYEPDPKAQLYEA